jgi:hypothetical protein
MMHGQQIIKFGSFIACVHSFSTFSSVQILKVPVQTELIKRTIRLPFRYRLTYWLWNGEKWSVVRKVTSLRQQSAVVFESSPLNYKTYNEFFEVESTVFSVSDCIKQFIDVTTFVAFHHLHIQWNNYNPVSRINGRQRRVQRGICNLGHHAEGFAFLEKCLHKYEALLMTWKIQCQQSVKFRNLDDES